MLLHLFLIWHIGTVSVLRLLLHRPRTVPWINIPSFTGNPQCLDQTRQGHFNNCITILTTGESHNVFIWKYASFIMLWWSQWRLLSSENLCCSTGDPYALPVPAVLSFLSLCCSFPTHFYSIHLYFLLYLIFLSLFSKCRGGLSTRNSLPII